MKKCPLVCLLIFISLITVFSCSGYQKRNETPSVREFLLSYAETHGKSPYAGTKIKLIHFWVNAEDFFIRFARDYSEIMGVDLDAEYQPSGLYITGLNTRIQTETVPEVFTMWPGVSITPYRKANVLLDLTDLDLDCYKTMSATARAACTYSGRMMVVPVNNSFVGIAYNKAIFARHNLAPPENLADFERIMDVLKTDPTIMYPMIWGKDTDAYMLYMMQISILYDKYRDFDERMAANTINYNNPENQFIYKKIFIDWPAAGYYNYDNYNGIDRMGMGVLQFTDGRAAMMNVGNWDMKVLTELNENNIPMGMFPVPGIDHSGNVEWAAGEAFAISAKATGDKKAAAIELLNILMSPDVNGAICGIIFSLSPYGDVRLNNPPEMILQLYSYVNDKARGWNVAPAAFQSKKSEAANILRAPAENKMNVLNDHLNTLDRIWKEAVIDGKR